MKLVVIKINDDGTLTATPKGDFVGVFGMWNRHNCYMAAV